MSTYIGDVHIRPHDDFDVIELDNGAGGKLYLWWPADGTPERRTRDQKQLNDLLEALRRVAVRRRLVWPV